MQRLWRWTKWLLLVLVLLVGLLAAFHKPLVLWALNRFGPGFASRAGLDLQWKVSGSLWSDLSIDSVKAAGTSAKIPITSLNIGKAALKYDLNAAWHRDYYKIAKGLVLHDVDAVIDLRHPAPRAEKPPASPGSRQALVDKAKQIGWPEVDIRNLNVTILLPEQTLKITGAELVLPPGQQGTLKIASIEHPALKSYPLRDITGKITIKGATLAMDDLKVPPQIEVPHLWMDAERLGSGEVVVSTNIRSGQASIVLDGKADLRGERPLVDATLDFINVDEKEVARWWPAMPELKARIPKLHIAAKGDPMAPSRLEASVSLEGRDIAFRDYRSESVLVEAGLSGGKLTLSKLDVSAGGNHLTATTQVNAPETWAEFGSTPLGLDWKLEAPALQSIAGLPVKISGKASGQGSVQFVDKKLQKYRAALTARDLALKQYQLTSLEASATGDLQAVELNAKARAAAGDGNLEARGKLGLGAGVASDLQWNLALPRPDELVKSLGVSWPQDVAAGEVVAAGTAQFELSRLKASQFNEAKGQGTLAVKQLSWRQAPVQEVKTNWQIADGKVSITGLEAMLPGENRARVDGSLVLSGERAFEGAVVLNLTGLPALQPWLNAVRKPQADADDHEKAQPAALKGGTVLIAWKGAGRLKDTFAISGDASVKADKVRYDALPEIVSVHTQFSHDLEVAQFRSFKGSYGAWNTSFHGLAGRTLVKLEDLKLASGSRTLMQGAVEVPLDLSVKPLPLPADRPLHIQLDTQEQLGLQDLAKMAKASLPPDVNGKVEASIKIDGTLPDLDANITIDAEDLRLPKVSAKEPGKAKAAIVLKNGQLTIDSTTSAMPLEPIEVHAAAKVDVPRLLNTPKLALDTPFEARVKLNQPSLDFVQPLVPRLVELKGSAIINATAKGTPRKPQIAGTVDLNVVSLAMDDPDLPQIRDLRARLVADGTSVKVESFRAVAAGGEVSLGGSCNLQDFSKPVFDLSLRARDMLVIRNDRVSMRTDADLRCQGALNAASLTGSVALTRGRVFQEVNFLPINKLMNDLPPLPEANATKAALQNLDSPGGAGPGSPLPPLFKDWTFNVSVTSKDPVRLLGNVMSGDVNVNLNASGTGAAPQVIGDVTFDEALLKLPFSTLRVKTGKINFERDHPFAPTLDLMAESSVDIYEIVLRGYGQLTDPKLRFTSTPPLPEGEIATLLATGATTQGLTKASDEAAGRLLFFAVREAYRRTFQSKLKPKRQLEKKDNSESRFTVQERSEDGRLGGVTATYEFSRKMKVVGSTNKEGGFRAMFHYMFLFD